ncbi:MAG: hypothetical protein AUJ96_05840 [Armatimonadetes bacterium CG2_30_66_41]|nr:MAG: hypothetical protein AUJ96_05840 [Armatimonadetes bacterium CG2_30_66_41]
MDRYTEFSRKNRYVLKCDLRKFFPSLDHEILLSILARKIGCRRTLDLLRLIVESSNPQEPVAAYFPGDDLFTPHERRRGLPIGNLTSQFFANAYLNPFDHFVKEELGCRFYIRYCDDFVIFGSDKRALAALVPELADRLSADLLRLIVESSNPQEPVAAYFPGDDLFTPHERRRGLPIGNLTSQFFANAYLNPFDHFVKEELGCRFYIRYCDDFVIFGSDKRALAALVPELADRLSALRLRLHERKCQVRRVDEGVDFLGDRIWPTHRRLRRESVLRFKRRRRHLRDARRAGQTDLAHVRASLASWSGHAGHADTWRLREQLAQTFVW